MPKKVKDFQKKERPFKTKSISLKMSDVDTKLGIITGYASTKKVMDSHRDILEDGVYTNTIEKWGPDGADRVKLLVQHNPWEGLIGKPLKLEEDTVGLKHESKITKTSLGVDTLRLIEDEVIKEQSIGYDEIRSEYNPDTNITHVQEIRLWEISFVTWGSNMHTPILGVKAEKASDLIEELQARFAKINNCLHTGEWESKEIPHLLELSMKRFTPLIERIDQQNRLQEELQYTKDISTATVIINLENALERATENILNAVNKVKIDPLEGEEDNLDSDEVLDMTEVNTAIKNLNIINNKNPIPQSIDAYMDDLRSQLNNI